MNRRARWLGELLDVTLFVGVLIGVVACLAYVIWTVWS